MNVKVSGTWRFVMHRPRRHRLPGRGTSIARSSRPERLAYTHVSRRRVHDVTVTFDEDGGETTVTMRMVFADSALRDKVAKAVGAVEGMQQTLGRMVEHVASLT